MTRLHFERERWRIILVALSIVGAGLILSGCFAFRRDEMQEPPPANMSEPPAVVGDTTTNEPSQVTPKASTPEPTTKVVGDDQPVSSPAGSSATDSSMTTTPQKINRPHIIGHVTDANGQAVGEAIVMITRGTAEFPERTYLTDANGKYLITVPSGIFMVVVNAEGFKTAEQEVEVKQGETILDFQLERE